VADDRKKKILQAATRREAENLRAAHGAKVASVVEQLLRRPVLFHHDDSIAGIKPEWSLDSSRWSLRRVSQSTVERFSKCLIAEIHSRLSVSFNEYRYMGAVLLSPDEAALVGQLAEALNDSIECRFGSLTGSFWIDYYDDPYLPREERFSLFITGGELLSVSEKCRASFAQL